MDRLTALHALVRVVKLGSFTAAADELGVKQSTVSKWVAELEATVGARLVERTTRSLRVTEAGRRLAAEVPGVHDAFEQALAAARGNAGLQGPVRLSLPRVFGRRYAVPVLAELLAREPGLELELVFADRYVRLVEEGFDLALRVGQPVDSALVVHRLARVRRRLVASPAYLETQGAPRTVAELKDHDCVLHTREGSGGRWAFEGPSGSAVVVAVRGRVAANDSEVALDLVRAGHGVALLAEWLVDADLREERLVPLLTDHGTAPVTVDALTAPGRFLSPRIRAVIEALRGGFQRHSWGASLLPDLRSDTLTT